ncbi:MAG: hypothetical protein K6F91_05355 [Ruminococcus sp.]|nr:hypothetical protein [Ruminococcus sp.]
MLGRDPSTSELFQPQADNAFRGGYVGAFGVNSVDTSATHAPSGMHHPTLITPRFSSNL